MNIEFTAAAWKDFMYWVRTDTKTAKKIDKLLLDIIRNPNAGIGKPELLKGDLAGYASRRISKEHRLVYRIVEDKSDGKRCIVVGCRFHY